VLVEARLHTNRRGVRSYLDLVKEHGPELDWHVDENRRGRIKTIHLGPERGAIPGFFLYTDRPVPSATTI
jgi:hypothetical protein